MVTEKIQSLFNSAIDAGRNRNYSKAILCLEEILTNTDQLPEALLYLGRSYHAIGELSRAVQALQFYLKIEPGSAEGHFFLARSYISLCLHKQSIRHLKKSIALDSNFAPAISLLGLNMLKTGKPRTAAKYFEQAMKLAPNQPRYFTGYLNALLTQAIRMYYRNELRNAASILQFIEKHRSESLVVHLYLASIFRELGDFAFSLIHFEKASRLAPKDPFPYLQKALIFLQQGDGEKAYDEMHQAMKILGRNAERIDDPQNLLRMMTLTLFQNKRYRQAIDCGRHVLKIEYHDAEMHAILGECYREVGELDKARNHYLRAIEITPSLELNYGLTAVLWQSSEYDELYKVLNRIFRRVPDDEFASYYLAISLPHMNKSFHKTIPIIQEQIGKSGPDPYLMSALGTEYIKAELPDLAEGWFLRALKQVKNHETSLRSLITVYKTLGNTEKLHWAYAEYINFYPDDYKVRKEYARSLFRKAQYQQASGEILKIIPYNQSNRYKEMLAVCYRNIKKYTEAIILFKELLRENPESEEILRSLAYCLEKANRRPTAIQLLEKASKVMKDRISILLPLGVMYAKEHELEKASKTFRQVISSHPNAWKAHRNLGIVYEMMGNSEFAQKFLKRAESLK